MKELTVDILLDLYRRMYLIRKTEEKLYYLFSVQSMPGTMHQYIGEEAVAAGVCANLKDTDYVTSTHRGHGHCLAKGASLNGLMAEMFAKSTGSCKGMGGSMHIADFEVGMLGANGIVGAGIPIATGAGITCKRAGKQQIAVSFFGDGAANEGTFHESINMASALKLPVFYVCENNLYGFSTQYRRVTNIENIADRAAAYGIRGIIADGMDAVDVYEKASNAIDQIRKTGEPVLLECKTYRFMGHARFEKPVYRTKEEVDEWKKSDPIPRLHSQLVQMDPQMEQAIAELEAQVQQQIEDAVAYAEASPSPAADDYKNHIFA